MDVEECLQCTVICVTIKVPNFLRTIEIIGGDLHAHPPSLATYRRYKNWYQVGQSTQLLPCACRTLMFIRVAR